MTHSNRSNWFGIILVIIGILFLMDNFSFPFLYGFGIHSIIFSWHTFFLIIGIVIIINHKNSFWGYVFIAIGLFGLSRHWVPFFYQFEFGDLWPIIFLAFGIWLILRRNSKTVYSKGSYNTQFAESQTEERANEYMLDESCSFSEIKRTLHTDNFKGGRISVVFGSVRIDLSDSKLAPGDNILHVEVVFGEVKLRVPPDWRVVINDSSLFGGFNDKRYPNLSDSPKSEGLLIIKGSTVFGGGLITN